MEKYIVITGAAGGLGMAIAKSLKGEKLIVTDNTTEKVKQVIKDLTIASVNAVGMASDITCKEDMDLFKDYCLSRGDIKAVVHCAGISGVNAQPKNVFSVDLLGTHHVVNAFEECLEPRGVMVLLSSMMGHLAKSNKQIDLALSNPFHSGSYELLSKLANGNADQMYNLSKRGVKLLVEQRAEKFGEKGARIISLSPGIILTKMGEKALEEQPEVMARMKQMGDLKRFGDPKEVAEVVKFLISDGASYITGSDVLVDGGLVHHLKD